MKTWLAALGTIAFAMSLSIEIWRRTERTMLTSKQAMFREEADWVMKGIESQLQNADNCTRMLGGTVYVPLSAVSVALNYAYDRAFPGPLKAGAAVTSGLILNDVTLESAHSSFIAADPSNGADMQTQSAFFEKQKLIRYPVRLAMSVSSKDGALSSTFTGPPGLTQPFYIWTNLVGTIVTCFGPKSVAAFCNSLGGFYHREASADPRPDLACRQSIHTTQWVDNRWTAKGSCRFGGVVQNPGFCASRFGSGFEPMQLQAAIPESGIDDSYMCVSCE